MLLSSPAAAGLFHRAILQSGGGERFAFDTLPPNERTFAASRAFVAHLGGGHPEELRRLPVTTIKEASHLFSGVIPKPGRVHTPANLAWMPVNDGVIVSTDSDSWAWSPIPLLLGYTRNEARYFIKPGMLPYNRMLFWVLSRALAQGRAGAVRAALASEGLSMYERFDRVYTNAVFAESALALAKRLLASEHRFYGYRFDRVSPGAAMPDFRAQHTAELRYIFGTLTTEGYDETDRRIAAWMQAQWVSFARHGIPDDGVHWQPYGESGQIVVIDESLHPGRIEDDPVMSIVHRLRAVPPASSMGLMRFWHQLWH